MRKVDPERVAQQREEIVQAAMRCFAARGVQGATTDDICREAVISPGRLYYYFASKDRILEAVAEEIHLLGSRNLAAQLREGDLLSSLSRYHASIAEEMTARGLSPALTLELFSQAGRSPGVQAAVQAAAALRLRTLHDALAQRKAEGWLRDDTDVDLLTRAVAAIYSGIEVLVLTDPEYDAERYRQAATMVLRPWLKEPEAS